MGWRDSFPEFLDEPADSTGRCNTLLIPGVRAASRHVFHR